MKFSVKHGLGISFVLLILIVLLMISLIAESGKKFFIDNQEENSCSTQNHIVDVAYEKDGIKASYPEFKLPGETLDTGKQKTWNQLIKKDFDQILQIYAFRPFPVITPYPTTAIPILLTINYNIMSNDEDRISIFYTADYTSKYSAHPSSLVYTTNIDKEKSKRLRLTDMIEINEDFVKDFRTWELRTDIKDPELLEAVNRYMEDLSDEELLQGFCTADQIGSDNPWGIYSYITPDRIGISIQVPNYIGDHIEYEKRLSELTKFLKPII